MGFKSIARKYTGWIDGQTWQSQIFGEQNRSITSQIPMLNLPRFQRSVHSTLANITCFAKEYEK
jgi:hypothetical protein